MDVASLLAGTLLVLGSAFAVVGGIGILRLPDLFTRLHAAGITDTMGAGLILTGLMLEAGVSLTAAKLIVILLVLWITSPTSAHALARAAIAQGLNPAMITDDEEEAPPG